MKTAVQSVKHSVTQKKPGKKEKKHGHMPMLYKLSTTENSYWKLTVLRLKEDEVLS